MERLTIKYDGHYVPEKLCTVDRYGEADDCEGCGGCEGEDCDLCPVQECFERLAEYEAIGLTPYEMNCKLGELEGMQRRREEAIAEMESILRESEPEESEN